MGWNAIAGAGLVIVSAVRLSAANVLCLGNGSGPSAYSEDLSVYRVDEQGVHLIADLGCAASVLDPRENDVAWHPNGKELVIATRYDTDMYRGGDLYRVILPFSAAHNITDSMGMDRHPAYSPDGSLIAYSADVDETQSGYQYELAILPVAGGERRLLTDTPGRHERYPCWSPDGSRLAAFRGHRLLIYDSRTGQVQDSLRINGVTPSFSPDGAAIAYASSTEGFWGIYVVDLSTGTSRRVVGGSEIAAQNYAPVWSPDGSALLFVSDRNSWRPAPSSIPIAYNPAFDVYTVTLNDLVITPVTDDPEFNYVYPWWQPGPSTSVHHWPWGRVKAEWQLRRDR